MFVVQNYERVFCAGMGTEAGFCRVRFKRKGLCMALLDIRKVCDRVWKEVILVGWGMIQTQ